MRRYKQINVANGPGSPSTYVSNEETLVGLYRFWQPFPLYDEPEHYTYTQRIYPIADAPLAMMTGKVYLVNGSRTSCQVIVTKDGHPKVCWTNPHCLRPVE